MSIYNKAAVERGDMHGGGCCGCRIAAMTLEELAAAGLPIFPALVTRGIKKPRITDWRKHATTDLKVLRMWRARWLDAVLGIELGRAGLVVIDADRHDGGPDGMLLLAALIGGQA